MKKLGLCQGRHEIPQVTGYIFTNEVNPLDVDGLELSAKKTLLELFPEVKHTFIHGTNIYITDMADVGYMEVRGCLMLYVTGLTVALVAVINACKELGITLTLMHYDRATEGYYPQDILS